METYQKIRTLFERNPNNLKEVIEGKFALPEFEYLQNNKWVGTEKIDGTNIRIILDGNIQFRGKTDKADIPPFLLEYLQNKFTLEKTSSIFFNESVCIYGEGYGVKIQKGGNYLADSNGFILFDIKIGEIFLQRDSLEIIADDIGVPIVPIIHTGTLSEMVEIVKNGFKSVIAEDKNYLAEGLVLKPAVVMLNREGERIISKLKSKDFDLK